MSDIDQRLKRLFPVGMRASVDLEIKLVCGFELFNTRPYHNYETWSNGWQAWVGGKLVVEDEHLQGLVEKLEKKLLDGVTPR